jgi:NAD(P)-dependent dehydrogenase (short-subunit alcohol dehydrogenase family)
VLAVPCDVTDAAQVCDLVSLVRERLGEVDVLVNNAGIIQVGPTEHMTLADYEEAMRINFYGPLHLALALAPAMRARGAGRIVNVSSIGGKFAVPHLGPYSASKFALVGLSEGLRVSLAKDGVHVTTVCPGEMRTGSPRHAIFKGDHEAEYAWFTTSDTAPVMSMDTVRAARRILDAARHGDAELVMPFPAWLQVRFHGIFPGLSADLAALFERGLPAPVAEGEGATRQHGRDVASDQVPAWARKIQERMAGRFNQRPETN